jgi:hypothetical protein
MHVPALVTGAFAIATVWIGGCQLANRHDVDPTTVPRRASSNYSAPRLSVFRALCVRTSNIRTALGRG